MNIRFTLLIVALFQLLACSSMTQHPQWLNQPGEVYAETDYLNAIGEASSLDAASNRALANLAKIFEVEVQDRSLDFSSSSVVSNQGVQSVSNDQQAARYVTTEANQVLEGAKVVESWQDEVGTFYALAVLEKSPASKRFRDNIRSADKKTNELLMFASTDAQTPVLAMTALNDAYYVQAQRQTVNRNLSVVSGNGITSLHDVAEIESTIRQALAALQFDVATDSDTLQTGLEGAVAALGIQYNKQSSYVLTATLDTEPVQFKQDWYWVRGSLEITLSQKGEVIAKQRWPLKVSATDAGVVEQRAKDHISAELSNYLYELMSSAHNSSAQ